MNFIVNNLINTRVDIMLTNSHGENSQTENQDKRIRLNDIHEW